MNRLSRVFTTPIVHLKSVQPFIAYRTLHSPLHWPRASYATTARKRKDEREHGPEDEDTISTLLKRLEKDKKNSAPKEELEEAQEDKEEEEELTEEELKQYEEELGFETYASDAAVSLFKKCTEGVHKAGQGGSLWPAARLMKAWYNGFENALKVEMQQTSKNKPIMKKLREISVDKVVAITLHQVMSLVLAQPHSLDFNYASFTIGRTLLAERNLERIKEENKEAFRTMVKSKSQLNAYVVNMKANHILKCANWDYTETVQVGEFLLKLLATTAFVDNDPHRALAGPSRKVLPPEEENKTAAFMIGKKKIIRSKVVVDKRLFQCHETVWKLLAAKEIERELSNIKILPMLCEPLPWIFPNLGSYLFLPCTVMRARDFRTQIGSLWTADLQHVYEALNVLGKVPWTINDFTYKYITEAWEAGGEIASIPSRKNYELPPKPYDYETNPDAQKIWKRIHQKKQQLNADLHSLRCDTLLKLLVAEKVKGRKFYLPHNLDFRGRAYPIPPHLNQLGSDFCRSLLLFHTAKPLGRKGIFWLKVHLANLKGVNKITLEQRVDFIDKNMDNVRDAAKNPLGGKRWWLDADDPWQALATCKEIVDAIDSGNPATFLSRLPVHQDGSCNGLQHYAALGGDEDGGKKVNLLPSDTPQDVYAGIATIVAKQVHTDAASGNEFAKILDGKVDRKVIKQTVMTSVYGVTYIGAKAQILNALQDKKIDWRDDQQLYGASGYIADCTFEALNQTFFGARTIMKWLAKCAQVVAKQKQPVSWETPLGLPITQAYFKESRQKTVVNAMNLDDMGEEDEDSRPLATRTQRTAFAPNFVHSLDSSHMMLTAIECAKSGIDFASVHDSYWTHAGTVDKMNSILREKFVQLHSQPLLQHLHDWFVNKYGKGGIVEFPPVPEKGPLDLKQVLKSRYFFH